MTAAEFDALKLDARNVIDITFEDGSKKRYLLYQGTATLEVPEKREYLTSKIVPSIPAKIVVQNRTTGGDEGLELSTIKEVILVRVS
jgi:hypothetical protein